MMALAFSSRLAAVTRKGVQQPPPSIVMKERVREQRLAVVKWNDVYKQCLAVIKESMQALTQSEKRRNDFHVYVIENLYSWEGI